MIKFLIKKSFFDIWDNFLPVFLSNLIAGILMLSFYIFNRLAGELPVGLFAVVCAGFWLVFCVWLLGINGMAFEFSHYRRAWGKGFWNAIIKHPFHLLFFYFCTCCLFFCIVFLMPFYLSSNSYIGIMLAVVLFWFCLVIVPSLQYYFPMALFMNDSAFLTFKKCLSLTLNNKLYTLFVSIKSILDFLLSVATCFIIPGFTGLVLGQVDSVKLLLMRYNYMLEHSVEKSDVNIYALFEEENKKIGPHSLRTMFMPWKDSK